jgi:hypothetical protein
MIARLLVFAVLPVAAGVVPARAEPLHVTGVIGYLSEWEVTGAVSETASGPTTEFAGPLTMKHVGLCRHNGPEEKIAEVRLEITRSSLPHQLHASLVFDGAKCTFGGPLADTYSGFMDCPSAKGVPITLSVTTSRLVRQGDAAY